MPLNPNKGNGTEPVTVPDGSDATTDQTAPAEESEFAGVRVADLVPGMRVRMQGGDVRKVELPVDVLPDGTVAVKYVDHPMRVVYRADAVAEPVPADEPDPPRVLAAKLVPGLYLATYDPADPGIRVLAVEVAGGRVGALLAGPDYVDYPGDQMVTLVDEAVVMRAAELAAQRSRDSALASGYTTTSAGLAAALEEMAFRLRGLGDVEIPKSYVTVSIQVASHGGPPDSRTAAVDLLGLAVCDAPGVAEPRGAGSWHHSTGSIEVGPGRVGVFTAITAADEQTGAGQ